MDYELIIVGAGPAGLSAALSAAYYKLKTVVFESASAGGSPINSYPWKKVDEFLGHKNILGHEVARSMVEHVLAEGASIRENEAVEDVKRKEGMLEVTTKNGAYACKAVILAIGLGVPRKLGIQGEGLQGVIYSLPKPSDYRGKRVVVVGGGDTALENALALRENGATVCLVHRGDKFRAKDTTVKKIAESGISCSMNTEVEAIAGSRTVEKLMLKDGSELKADCALLSLGTVPNKDFLERAGVKLSEKNNIIVDQQMRTSIQGIFAAGDVTGRWIRIPNAIGEGGFAGLNAFKYVKNPYWA
ncbi:MAG: FAD-dependent oxidoreductase [Candidatus Altiarchaeota archaeon]|nr:FAD-dependent oxidoreductase [Candidatus Altiarchaeota archaeon]